MHKYDNIWICGFKRDRIACSKYDNHFRFQVYVIWRDLYDHSMSTIIFMLVMNKILIWAPKIMRSKWLQPWFGFASCLVLIVRFITQTWYSWRHHMACKKCRKCLVFFSNTRNVGLNWSLEAALPTTSRCFYTMLVACASDNEGRSFLIWRILCSSLLLQARLIAIKTKHSWWKTFSSLL